MKKLRFLFIVFFIMMLTGCGGIVKVYTYISDLINIASRRSNAVYINANIVVEGLKDNADISFLKII